MVAEVDREPKDHYWASNMILLFVIFYFFILRVLWSYLHQSLLMEGHHCHSNISILPSMEILPIAESVMSCLLILSQG